MGWPTSQDYNEAIQNPRHNLGDPELQKGVVDCNKLGLPRPITGAFASVYRVTAGKKVWAVRCFDREIPADTQRRYAAIDKALKRAALPYTVGFVYERNGILVRGEWYPIVKMEWVYGVPLNEYVQNSLHDPAALRALAGRWMEMVQALERADIAHGDLQHGNVLVSQGQLRLVDYDGMYVPGLLGLPSHELGHPNYQHPRRGTQDFAPELDRFSSWLVYVSLYALSVDPDLWKVLNGGDDCLLVRRSDLENPGASSAFALMRSTVDASIPGLVSQVQAFLAQAPLQVPVLDPPPPAAPQVVKPSSTSPGVKSDWYRSYQTTPGGAAAFQPAPPPELPALPAPPALPQYVGARAWVPNLQPARTRASRQFAPIPQWQRLLALSALPVLALSVAALKFFPLFSPIALVIVVGIAAVSILRFHRDPVVQERRRIRERVVQTKREITVLNRRLQTLQKERQAVTVAHQKICVAYVNVRPEIQESERQERERKSNAVQKRVASFDTDLRLLAQREQAEISAALSHLQEQYIAAFLHNSRIERATIPGVGRLMKKRLVYAGITTAAQADPKRVRAIMGFGIARAQAVDRWVADMTAAARQSAPAALNRVDEMAIEEKFAAKRKRLEGERTRAQQGLPADLATIASRHKSRLETQEAQLFRDAQAAVEQARVLDSQVEALYRDQVWLQFQLEEIEMELAPFSQITSMAYVRAVYLGSEIPSTSPSHRTGP